MGFIDNVSVFTKGVGAKAKGNYDVVSMNAQISAIKKEIIELYKQIGEAYYKEHSTSPEDCVSDLVNNVSGLLLKIEELNNQIEITKSETASVQLIVPSEKNTETSNYSGRKCRQCGTPLGADDVFCPSCGTKNEIEEIEAVVKDDCVEVSKIFCPDCGTELTEEDLFCFKCGHKMQ